MELAPHPTNTNVVGFKWVYIIKYREDSSSDRFKAKLVAKGFAQVLGIAFNEIFNPIVKSTIIRLILALVVSSKWIIKQLMWEIHFCMHISKKQFT